MIEHDHNPAYARRSRRDRRCVVRLALAIVAALAATGSLALAGSAAGRRPAARVLQLRGQDVDGWQVDNAPTGTSLGDMLGFVQRVERVRGGRFGTAFGDCTLVDDGTAQCAITLVAARGSLAFRCIVEFGPRPRSCAVVGGTGRFAGARGDAVVTPTNADQTRDAIVVKLRA